jgi:hypothetical protein
MTMDFSKFSKTALKAMLEDKAFSAFHEAIKAHLTPKPKDMTPVEGKVSWRAAKSTMSTTVYPKGYVRLEVNSGNGCLYKEAAEEMIQHLMEVLPSLKSYSR